MMKYHSQPLEVKLLEESDGVALYEGYAATFDNVDRVHEYFLKGAFEGAKARDIPLLWNHDQSEQIGSHKALYEDDKGLFIKARINLGVRRGVEAYALMKAGDLSTMSVGYRVNDDAYDPDKRARVLKKVTLMEISLASVPANTQAKVTQVKSLDGSLVSIREFKNFLREVGGLSNSEADCVIAKGYGQLFKEKNPTKVDLSALSQSIEQFHSALRGSQ